MVFNEKNWKNKAWLLFQVDPKLKKKSHSVFQGRAGNIPLAWTLCFFLLSGLFLFLGFYHRFFLPHPKSDSSNAANGFKDVFLGFGEKFFSFFRQKDIGIVLGVLLLYRLGESQLVKLAAPFLLDAREIGGFDVLLRWGGEDQEFFSRIRSRKETLFVPEAIVFHRQRESLREVFSWFAPML